MAENWENGLPDEGRSPEFGYRMAAEGMPFPWRWTNGTISTNLYVSWGMSVEAEDATSHRLSPLAHRLMPSLICYSKLGI